jgi:N-formylglutamate amidohydrolase
MMIEVNRRLYMDERTGERLAKFDQTREAVGKMLSAGLAFLLEE